MSELLVDGIISMVEDVLIRYAPDGTVEWASPSLETAFGYLPSDVVGTPLRLVPPDEPDIAAAALREAVARRKSVVRTRSRAQGKDGEGRWIDTMARLVWSGDDLVCAVASIRDVTALVAEELEREERERLLSATLESIIDPHLLVEAVRDPSGAIVDFVCRQANPAACSYLETAPETLIGSRMLETFSGGSVDPAMQWCVAVLESGRPLSLDDQVLTSSISGSPRRFDVRIVPVGDAVSATWRDVTDRSTAVAAMVASEAHYRLLADNSIDVVVHTSAGGIIDWVSPSVEEILGWKPAEIAGRRMPELIHPDDLPHVQQVMNDLFAAGAREGRTQFRMPTADGDWRWMSDVGRAIVSEDGTLLGGIDALRDIQVEHDAREALRLSEEHYRLLAENSSDVVFRGTADARIEWISPSVREVLGWEPTTLIGTPTLTLVHADDRPLVQAALRTSGGPGVRSYEARFLMADGRSRWMGVTVRPVFSAVGTPVAWVGSARDVQTEHETREELRRSEERFRAAMDSAPSGMAVVSLEQRFLQVNSALCRLLLRSEDWLLAHRVTDVIDAADEVMTRPIRSAVISGAVRSGAVEHQMVRSDGSRIWVDHSIGLLRDDDGSPIAFVCQFNDVTEPRQARHQLQFLATHDVLTELVNRRELVSTVTTLLGNEPRTGRNVALLFIDLDGLKQVNDTFGHGVGDEVIVEVARRIRGEVRESDTVARFGGDEFVVVLPRIHTVEDAERLAEKIQNALASPVIVDGVGVHVSLSIGIAVATPGEDADEALRRADAALYQAKRGGRAQTIVDEASRHKPA